MRRGVKWSVAIAGMVVVSLVFTVGSAVIAGVATAAGTPVKIMLIAPTQNQIANYPDFQTAGVVAQNLINSEGGVGASHQSVKVIYCNDMFNPNTAATCARQAVSGNYAAVTGFSDWGTSIEPVLQTAKIPLVGFWPANVSDYQYPYAFLTGSGTTGGYIGDVAAAKALGKKSIASLVEEPNPNVAFVQQAAQFYGLSYKGEILAPPTTTDYAPLVAQLQQSGAQAVNLQVGPTEVVGIVQAGEQSGFTPLWLLPDGNISQNDLSTLGAASDGIVFTGSYPPVTTNIPQLQTFVKAYKAAVKKGTISNVPLGATGESVWVALEAIKQGMSKAATVNAASIDSTFPKTKNMNLFGVIPPWTPGASGPPLLLHLSNPYEYADKWTGSKYVPIQSKAFNLSKVLGTLSSSSS